VYIAKVDENNGLKEGDIITAIDDNKVKEDTDLRNYLYQQKKPGDTVKLTLERKGKVQTVKVDLKEQKSASTQSSNEDSEDSSESANPFN
ncbi:PDZ domain-containing protein, partial [Staphylococcus succinus]